MEIILDKSPSLIDATAGKDHQTPLHFAVKGRFVDVVAVLLQKVRHRAVIFRVLRLPLLFSNKC